MIELHKHLKFNGSLSNYIFKLDGESLPESLLYALRIYNAEMIDITDFDKAREGKPLSSHNERKVLEDILGFCTEFLKSYPTTRAEDKNILLGGKLSVYAKYAVILRRAEKRILNSIKKLALSRLEWVKQNWNTRPTEGISSEKVKITPPSKK